MNRAQFEDGGKTFTCVAASSPATPGVMWWWVSISGESQRYAAFRTEKGDTEDSLRRRVIEYYAKILADRARPAEVRPSWSQRRPAAVVPPAPPSEGEPETK